MRWSRDYTFDACGTVVRDDERMDGRAGTSFERRFLGRESELRE